MIIITGSCRSGTSMMMQTLQLLGVAIAGEASHPDFPVVEGNPKGYFDLPFKEHMDGIDIDKYQDKAIKVLGEWLLRVPSDSVTHIIVCKRRAGGAQDRSTIKLLKKELEVESSSKERDMLLPICAALTPTQITERRVRNYHCIDMYLENFMGYCMEVYFEDMIYNPIATITNLKEFLHLETDVSTAVENIGI